MMKIAKDGENDNESERTFGNFFLESNERFCDFVSPSSPPKWLNRELYSEGVRFFWDNVFMIFISMLQSLIAGLSNPNLRLVQLLLFHFVLIQPNQQFVSAGVNFVAKREAVKLVKSLTWAVVLV